MITTIKFRLHPTASQEQKLQEIFTIYNRVRRAGYKLYFTLKDVDLTKTDPRKLVQPRLMELWHNNPYVNSILIDCETKLAGQQTWYEKREKYLKLQIITIDKRIEQIKQKTKEIGV